MNHNIYQLYQQNSFSDTIMGEPSLKRSNLAIMHAA